MLLEAGYCDRTLCPAEVILAQNSGGVTTSSLQDPSTLMASTMLLTYTFIHGEDLSIGIESSVGVDSRVCVDLNVQR